MTDTPRKTTLVFYRTRGGIEVVRDWLKRLDPDDRALLAMRYGAGFDSNELALATGRRPAAIRQRLKRLLDRLREDLDDG